MLDSGCILNIMNANKNPTVGIIGTINYDHVLGDGFEYEDLGGIMYNILGIHYLSRGQIIIKPVVNYGFDIEKRIHSYLRGKHNIDRSGFYRQKSKNPRTILKDVGREGKEEILKYRAPQLSYRKISSLTDCDMILLNFISGRDIKPETVRKLRQHYDGIIYTDIHSFVLGIKPDGSRYYRSPERWQEVVESSNIVQMNLKEAITLLEIDKEPKQLESAEIGEIGWKFMELGPTIVVLTAGSEGARAFWQARHQRDSFSFKPGVRGDTAGSQEATGCGDVLTSAFIVSIFAGCDLKEGLEFAVNVATQKYHHPGLSGAAKLSKYGREIRSDTINDIDIFPQ